MLRDPCIEGNYGLAVHSTDFWSCAQPVHLGSMVAVIDSATVFRKMSQFHDAGTVYCLGMI